jgi:hypothetical protein
MTGIGYIQKLEFPAGNGKLSIADGNIAAANRNIPFSDSNVCSFKCDAEVADGNIAVTDRNIPFPVSKVC